MNRMEYFSHESDIRLELFRIDSGLLMVVTNLNSKRQNLSVEDTFLVDRIGNLPDSVISHILSFLPTTKEVVATSILAKQWRYLWTSVDKFDFTDNIYGVSVVKVQKYFKPFVYRVLKLHQGNIKELRLSCSDCGCKELDVTNWINDITARGVERLVLITQLMYTCPRSVFTCKTLVDLKMGSYDIRNMNIPSAPFFPCLKKLHIGYLKYDTESLKHFILQCSALEHFVLRSNVNVKENPIEIVSSTLKRLELSSSYYGFDEMIHLSVPSLEHLQFWYSLPPELSIEEQLAFLVEADINLRDHFWRDVHAFQLRESFVRFIQHFANVKVLGLNCHLIKFLTSVGHAQFPNLTKLGIQSSYFEWRLLVSFMESSINLEALTLRKMSNLKKHNLAWKEPKNVPFCLSSSLRKISIHGYSEDELAMVKYALRTAEFLERMEICCRIRYKDTNEVKSGMLQTIQKLTGASERCIISLV